MVHHPAEWYQLCLTNPLLFSMEGCLFLSEAFQQARGQVLDRFQPGRTEVVKSGSRPTRTRAGHEKDGTGFQLSHQVAQVAVL